MPRFAISVPHALGQEEAVRRLKERFRALAEAYDDDVQEIQEDWAENVLTYSFIAFSIPLSGTATVESSEVKVETEVPLMAIVFKGTIETQFREDLTKLLA